MEEFTNSGQHIIIITYHLVVEASSFLRHNGCFIFMFQKIGASDFSGERQEDNEGQFLKTNFMTQMVCYSYPD